MSGDVLHPPFDQFLATAAAVAQARPDVDPEIAREVFLEAATSEAPGAVHEPEMVSAAYLVAASILQL